MTACVDSSHRLTLTLRNDRSELPRLTEWIIAACKAAALTDKTSFALQLCLDEAVANIMEHGEGAARATEIVISVTHDGEAVLAVEDDGAAFDPTGIAAPPRRESLDDLPIGGLGIHLMRQYTSSIRYERRGDRNHLRLAFARR